MLPSMLGGDYFQGKLKENMQGERDERRKPVAGEHGAGGHEEEHRQEHGGKHKPPETRTRRSSDGRYDLLGAELPR